MGSPQGPLMADMFMAKMENNQLKSTIESLAFYTRYVDDIFCLANADQDPNEILTLFDTAHSSMRFTIEKECNNELAFLDVNLTRLPDGTIRRTVYRKKTYSGQYINFNSFVPIRIKRNLVSNLTLRARYICSEDTLTDELDNLKNIFRDNGYQNRFIERNMKPPISKPTTMVASKKKLFIRLPFKGDAACEIVTRTLRNAVNRTFGAAELQCSFSSSRLIQIQQKDKLPLLTASMVIYSFRCVCGATYIGRTARHLSKRISEHQPKWVLTGRRGVVSSAVCAHLAETGHRVDVKKAFQIVYRVPVNKSKAVRLHTLAKAEAISIKLLNPDLCAQKRFVVTLSLPWPERQTNADAHTPSDTSASR